jgi:Flp pilus assembly protein TadD
MIDLHSFGEFRVGLARLRDGQPAAAVELLRRAVERDPENPYYTSYYGLSLGHSAGRWAEAEQLCHTAVCRRRRQAQLYLNLAEVYLATGRRQGASDTLARGLHYMPHDRRLQTEFCRLMLRRPPVLGFLARSHALNRSLGRMRHRMLQTLPRRRWLMVGESQA